MSSTDGFSSDTEETKRDKYYHEGGKLIANPPPGEEIVISGMAGIFANCRNISELEQNLFNKVDLVRANNRWDCDHPGLPARLGAAPDIDRYDGGFFGVHERQSHSLDAMGRILQEKVLEAIFDAGLHPSELEGTKTGVYVGVTSSENERTWFLDNLKRQTFAMTGSKRSMLAHRISYFLKLKGPSTTLDNSCSSSTYALETAYTAIRSGEIENAIVGGTHLCLNPSASIYFLHLGVLNKIGCCKTFDIEANGFARSEGVVAVILQKANHSKRIYAQIVHVKTNCDGFKEEGITFPSKDSQMELFRDVYQDCGVNRFSLGFLEAHGTGTTVGDVQEGDSIDGFFASGRHTPLLVGAMKSNIGHTEATSCLSSIVKCILAMETDYIPPNIHFKTPNNAIAGLIEGRLKVVVDKTPLEDENVLMGVNSMGFGGTNAHVLLKRTSKRKVDSKDHLPRLACVSGRTEEAVNVLLDQIEVNATDVEYVKLLHEVFGKAIRNHLYRGYIVASRFGAILKSFAFYPGRDKPLYVVFGELENWQEIGRQLMALPVFRDSILRIQECLKEKGANISDALLTDGLFDGYRFPALGAVAVQMAMVHLLELVEVRPKRCFGYSLGELASAYYDKLLTLEETVHWAFVINEAVLDDNRLRDAVRHTMENLNIRTNRGEQYGNTLKDEIIQKIKPLTRSQSYRSGDVQANSIILNISPVILDEAEEVPVIPLFGKGNEDYLMEFLEGLGRLYLSGHNPQIDRLYPRVDFPVGRGTPMISPHIRWNHSRKKFLPPYHLDFTRQSKQGIGRYKINTGDRQWAFITEQLVDGKHLFPVAGYLYMVWETFSIMRGVPLNASKVSLRNCRFMSATDLPSEGSLVLTVSILTGSGNFEIVEGKSTVATGTINLLRDDEADIGSLRSPDLKESQGLWMNRKDVYKELRLRGYLYGDEFQALEKYNPLTSTAYLKWTENWMAFLDNILQLSILQTDSRALLVPTFISMVNIATDAHLGLIEEAFKNPTATTRNLPVYSDRSAGIITCGGVTVSGIIMSHLVKKRNLETPLLESHEFIPNFTELALCTSVRVNVQIILENTSVCQWKAVEIIDEFSDDNVEPLTAILKSHVQQNELLRQPVFKILSAKSLDVDVDVENKKLENESDCLLVIVSKTINRPEILISAFAVLKENGFVISRESPHCEVSSDLYPNVSIVTAHRTPSETILLLRKRSVRRDIRCIELNSSDDFSWLPELQDALNKNPQQDLVLYSVDPMSGILGMMRCLRKEYSNGNIRCVFLMSGDEKFDLDSRICGDQLEKNLAFNVYRKGQWGTFRHLPLEDSNMVECEHCFVDVAPSEVLSSLRWIEGALVQCTVPEPEKDLIYVYYSALNSSDLGKICTDSKYLDREGPLERDFSGRDRRGKRVMGWCVKGVLSNLLLAETHLIYSIPEEWTMEEAATVPVVYTMAIYALIMRGQMRRGESILIHSGAGGVGQAAINLALHYVCEVFTTVGTQEEYDFLKKAYPQLKDENIGNSHDDSFEQMVLERTNGRGVDVVLDSLAGEKLAASVGCLAVGGRFLEVEKFDFRNDVRFSLELLKKQASFHAVVSDEVFGDSKRCGIREAFERLVGEGAVRPLNKRVFKREEIEQAFGFAATGRQEGTVLIQVREPEEQLVILPSKQTLHAVARYYCDPQMVYLIAGGLGGFGLELADWLVRRGARKLVLTSRKGITTGYQQYRIRWWESHGVVVKISTAPLATREGCEQLMEEASRLGHVAAVFNLTVALNDAIFENQTPKTFTDTFEPKVVVTRYLEEVTRTACPQLRDFVVFSSGVSTMGNAGQTNYGMANCAMEKICERRRQDGYPALAIRWGIVGEVGIAAEKLYKTEMDGVTQQPISSCLEVLDTLLARRDAVIVSSIVAARNPEWRPSENIVDTILYIIGMKDSKYVSMHSTLAELGMDSIIAIEVKGALERNFEIFLSTEEMRTATLARLQEIQEEKIGPRGDANTKHETNFGTDLGDNMPRVVPELDEKSMLPRAVLFPGVEGFAGVLKSLSGKLAGAKTVQYVPDEEGTSVAKIVESLLPTVRKLLPQGKTFFFVAYSYGVLIALEMVHILESQGYSGTLIAIDGGPLLSESLANIYKCQTREESINFAAELAKNYDTDNANCVKKVAHAICQRHQDLNTYQPTYKQLKSNVKLFKPTLSIVQQVEDDYGLSQFFQKSVEIEYFEGNHETILENEKLADAIHLSLQKPI